MVKKMRVAALDLGSTSFHLVVVDVDADGRMERVLRRREVLHLGAIVDKLAVDETQTQ